MGVGIRLNALVMLTGPGVLMGGVGLLKVVEELLYVSARLAVEGLPPAGLRAKHVLSAATTGYTRLGFKVRKVTGGKEFNRALREARF